jgi:hypothetical protein
MTLSTSSNFAKPDDAFRAIVEAHRGLSDAQSADFDAAMVLILANDDGGVRIACGGEGIEIGADLGESDLLFAEIRGGRKTL